jgi:hypothetical protein
LVPNLRGKDGFLSSNGFREIKKAVQERAGVEFRIKDFRPTFAQTIVDKDPSLLPDVSTILGHSNLANTQRYYAQIRGATAIRRVEKLWDESPDESHGQHENLKKHLIESKTYLSGYTLWWTDRDLNPRPPDCKSGDLPV